MAGESQTAISLLTNVDLIKANPLYLRPLLQSDQFRNVPFVLLHAGYPYVRELGYLAAMYPNVFMDISLAIPFVTTMIPIVPPRHPNNAGRMKLSWIHPPMMSVPWVGPSWPSCSQT